MLDTAGVYTFSNSYIRVKVTCPVLTNGALPFQLFVDSAMLETYIFKKYKVKWWPLCDYIYCQYFATPFGNIYTLFFLTVN